MSAHWFLTLDSFCSAGLDGALENEAEKTYVSAAASLSRHQSFSNYITVDLAVLRELSQELADLFGLTLPVSLKCEGLVEDKL